MDIHNTELCGVLCHDHHQDNHPTNQPVWPPARAPYASPLACKWQLSPFMLQLLIALHCVLYDLLPIVVGLCGGGGAGYGEVRLVSFSVWTPNIVFKWIQRRNNKTKQCKKISATAPGHKLIYSYSTNTQEKSPTTNAPFIWVWIQFRGENWKQNTYLTPAEWSLVNGLLWNKQCVSVQLSTPLLKNSSIINSKLRAWMVWNVPLRYQRNRYQYKMV